MRLGAIEWTGSAGGVAGAAIVALNLPWSGWGFAVFLVATGLLLAAAIGRRSWPHVALFAAYTAANVIGIYRWLLAS